MLHFAKIKISKYFWKDGLEHCSCELNFGPKMDINQTIRSWGQCHLPGINTIHFKRLKWDANFFIRFTIKDVSTRGIFWIYSWMIRGDKSAGLVISTFILKMTIWNRKKSYSRKSYFPSDIYVIGGIETEKS